MKERGSNFWVSISSCRLLVVYSGCITWTLPTQWNEAVIYPIFKEGHGLNCNDSRPITLLNSAYKIFAILLNKRLSDIVGEKMEEGQMGFRPNIDILSIIYL